MPEIIPTDVCHWIVGGLSFGLICLGTTILGLAWYVLKLQGRNDEMQTHMNDTNDGVTNLLAKIAARKTNVED